MARTSRRYEIQKEEISKSVYRAGVYVRLSSERHEEWREKSSSLPKHKLIYVRNTQKAMVYR